MSLKSLGSVAKVAKEINNLSTKQRKRNGSNAARSVFDRITSSDTPESLIKQWTSAGMSKDAVYDMLTHAGRSEKIQGFSEKEAKQALNNAGIQKGVDQAKEIANAMNSVPEATNKAKDSFKDFNGKTKDAEKSTTGFASKFKTSMKDSVEKTHAQFSNGVTKFKAKLGDVKSSISSVGTGLKETMVANLPAVLLAAGTAAAAGVNALVNNIRSRALNAGISTNTTRKSIRVNLNLTQ